MWILVVIFKVLLILTLSCSSKGDDCPTGWFKCGNGMCLASIWVCDGSNDCGNFEDEKDCGGKMQIPSPCLSSQFKCESDNHCIPQTWYCDGDRDCSDQSDEIHCKDVGTCNGFQCRDGKCIPGRWHCDEQKDCSDGSDEELCQKGELCLDSEFICSSGSCLNRTLVCDGKKHCKDGSDEGPHCDPCTNNTCSQHCKSTPLGPKCYCSDGFALDDKDNKTCRDINECLEDGFCSHTCINTPGSFKCICNSGYELVNRTCRLTVAHTVCKPEELLCPGSKRCISRKQICDGYADCPDGYDEGRCTTTTTLPPVSEVMSLGLTDIKDSEFIFYNERYRVYAIKQKDGNDLVDVLPDFQNDITGLCFQPKTQILYIADDKPSIYAVDRSSMHVRKLVKNNLSSPKDVKFDWMSNNLYWVDTNKGTIEVVSVDTLKRIVLIDNLSKPVSLAISPYRGTMFVSEIGFEPSVSLYGMDGKDKIILHSVQGWPMSLALHPSKTLLYWSDPWQETISYLNYTRESPPRTLMRYMGVMSVAASEDRIFYTAGETPQQSYRTRLLHGKVHEIKLTEPERNKGWKNIAYSHGMKPSGKSECLIKNGGCSYLCLTSPNGRTCACSAAMTLDKDGLTCLGKQCAKSYFRCSDEQCIPGGMKCDGNVDCNDGSDEQNCAKHGYTP